jgi:polyisoprenoid-binding protein YceI
MKQDPTLVRVKRATKIVISLAVAGALAVTAGPFIYINVIRDEAPDVLSIDDATEDTATVTTLAPAAVDDPSGEWTATDESVVGYRVKEILFGQDIEAVGRTSAVTGVLSVSGTRVNRAEFEVDMATIQSDSDRRDGQFNGRIMDVATYPTATFALSSPIDLPDNALSGDVINASATGDLTLRGLTKPVTLDLQAQVNGSTVQVVGSITIEFDEWGIPDPSFSGAQVEQRGVLEFSLVFARA